MPTSSKGSLTVEQKFSYLSVVLQLRHDSNELDKENDWSLRIINQRFVIEAK